MAFMVRYRREGNHKKHQGIKFMDLQGEESEAKCVTRDALLKLYLHTKGKGVNMSHDGTELLCKHHIIVCGVRCENVLRIF